MSRELQFQVSQQFIHSTSAVRRARHLYCETAALSLLETPRHFTYPFSASGHLEYSIFVPLLSEETVKPPTTGFLLFGVVPIVSSECGERNYHLNGYFAPKFWGFETTVMCLC
ncbi:hypothetical protein J6590_038691 [Homalodisca vitripennis]|nr:hypothetical protein J6590_038691 [Homalodisca vitripennis]